MCQANPRIGTKKLYDLQGHSLCVHSFISHLKRVICFFVLFPPANRSMFGVHGSLKFLGHKKAVLLLSH